MPRTPWTTWTCVPLATLLFACGRTELGEGLGYEGFGGAAAGTPVTSSDASFGGPSAGSEGSGSFVAAATIGNASASTNATSTVVGTTLSTSGVTSVGSSGSLGGSSGEGGEGGGGAGGEGAGQTHSWDEPMLIETDEPNGAWQVQIAMNDDGAAVVALFDYGGDSSSSVWAAPYTRDAGWSDAELLATDHNLGGARVAIDDEGTAVVVWQGAEPAPNLWSRRFGVGTGWEAPESVNPDGVVLGGGPSVAMDATGSALVVWSDYDGTKAHLWSNRHAPESGWDNAVQIHETTRPIGPRLAMSRTGHAIAVWHQWDDAELNIWSSRSEAGVNWTLPEPVPGASNDTGQDPDVAVDPEGNGVTVWGQYTDSRWRVRANRFVAGVGWDNAQVIDTAPLDATQPTVGMDSDGSAVAVWLQSDGTAATVWSNRYSVDSGWGEAVQISSRAAACYTPAVAVGSAGDAVAAWAQLQDDGAIAVWSNRYAPGVGWLAPEIIDAPSPGTSGAVDVGIDRDGNAIAVWSHSDGGPFLYIWANHSSRLE